MQDTNTPDTGDTQAPNASAAVTICVADNGNAILWQGDDAIVVAPADIERLARALLKLIHPPTALSNAERQRRYRERHRNDDRNAEHNGTVTPDD